MTSISEGGKIDQMRSRDLSPSTEKSSGAVAPRITEAALPVGEPFVLGETWPDWWAAWVSSKRVITGNHDGRWRGGPDYAEIHVPGGVRVVKCGHLVTAADFEPLTIPVRQRWAKDLTDAELNGERRRLNQLADTFFDRDPDEELGGGSPGEGMFERLDEVKREWKRRRTPPDVSDTAPGNSNKTVS